MTEFKKDDIVVSINGAFPRKIDSIQYSENKEPIAIFTDRIDGCNADYVRYIRHATEAEQIEYYSYHLNQIKKELARLKELL